MMKKVLLRAGIAVAAVAVAVAFVPRSVLDIRNATPLTSTGATEIAFNPAANPAFKVNGGTACAAGLTGHLWAETTITATSVANSQTDEVVVELGTGTGGRTYHLLKTNGFSATVSTGDSFGCSALTGTTLKYTATSYKNGSAQNGPSAVGSGDYNITKID